MDCYTVPKFVNYGVLYWASGCQSWCVILCQWMWIMVSFTVPVVVNNDVSCWVSGCELCCAMLVNNNGLYCVSGCEFVMLCQLLWVMVSYIVPRVWIMVCNAQPVVVNHGVLCWASGCELLCALLRQWLCIMVGYAEPVVLNHCVIYWSSGCELWWVRLNQWLWIMVCNAEQVIVNHGV